MIVEDPYTAQKMKFSIKDFFSKCDQIRRKHFLCSDVSELLLEDYQIEISGLIPLRHNFHRLIKDLILRHWP